jgi:drug/metabolite transporter (DMT)-like permease
MCLHPRRAPMTLSSQPSQASRILHGIYYMLAAVLLFSCMDALIKAASADYPTGQIVFFRNLFAFIPVFYFLRQAGGIAVLRTRRPRDHILRGIVGVTAMGLVFTAFKLLPLAEAVALTLAGPIFLTALSVPLLGEKVGFRRWSAVIAGFIGILVMTRPGAGLFDPAAFFALGGAVFYALAMISIRWLSATEPAATTVFYFTLFATIVGALTLPFQWQTPDVDGFVILAGIGLIGGIAQMAMTQAFRLAPASIVAPFEYLALVFAVGLGYAFWDEVPDAFIIAGSAIVIASGLYILHREAVRGRTAAGIDRAN